MGTVGYLALAVAAAALAIAIIRSTRRAPPLDASHPDAFEEIVAGLRAGRLALDPRIPDNAPPEHKPDR